MNHPEQYAYPSYLLKIKIQRYSEIVFQYLVFQSQGFKISGSDSLTVRSITDTDVKTFCVSYYLKKLVFNVLAF